MDRYQVGWATEDSFSVVVVGDGSELERLIVYVIEKRKSDAGAFAAWLCRCLNFQKLALAKRWLRHTDLCGVHLATKDRLCTCGLTKALSGLVPPD
jgi:hypothetical protein